MAQSWTPSLRECVVPCCWLPLEFRFKLVDKAWLFHWSALTGRHECCCHTHPNRQGKQSPVIVPTQTRQEVRASCHQFSSVTKTPSTILKPTVNSDHRTERLRCLLNSIKLILQGECLRCCFPMKTSGHTQVCNKWGHHTHWSDSVAVPTYNPNLRPCSFDLFGSLKDRLQGNHLANDRHTAECCTRVAEEERQ